MGNCRCYISFGFNGIILTVIFFNAYWIYQRKSKCRKRVAITPEIVKKYLSLGFEVCLSENYGTHLGIKDDEYLKLGAKI